MRTVTGMILEVGLAKHQVVAFEKKIDENRRRLNERLSNAGMKEKCPIPGDGNCQFYSDQLYDAIDRAAEIRHRVVEWLRVNNAGASAGTTSDGLEVSGSSFMLRRIGNYQMEQSCGILRVISHGIFFVMNFPVMEFGAII
eukprot:TRINITY_DN4615_c0_g1_i3.p1 TRINITY_DN4615_c0_g1~~TRINITY_DN4615_c0_g1_i3.p1  ORF type:complete len:141 (-),score=33.48 TRINITY_DN4615_c0_g1_i3:215-637(-)